MLTRLERVQLLVVQRPGSLVPGPPLEDTVMPRPSGGGAALMEATSKTTEGSEAWAWRSEAASEASNAACVRDNRDLLAGGSRMTERACLLYDAGGGGSV